MKKLYRISKCKYIDDLKGTGAASYAGRWHSKGTYILYTAATASLALLEAVAHIAGIPPDDYCMLCIEIPEDNMLTLNVKDLPENWYANPSPGSLTAIGDYFVRKNQYLALQLPSAIMPEDHNVLINPGHKDFAKIKVLYKRIIPIDKRLL